MPTYLCHGFRWHRRAILIFVIHNDLDECSPGWLVGRTSSELVLRQFAQNFDFLPDVPADSRPLSNSSIPGDSTNQPQTEETLPYVDDFRFVPSRVNPSEDNVLMHAWSPVKLLEEYDETEKEHASRPYAYVADYVLRIDLGVDIAAEMKRHESADWFGKLRDKLQEGQEMGWYVVVCDDCDRLFKDNDSDSEDDVTSPKNRDSASTSSSASGRPAFLKTDPCERPAAKPRKKLSIKRLFRKDANE